MIKLKRGRICDGRMGRSTVELREPLRFSDLCFAKKESNASFFMWWSSSWYLLTTSFAGPGTRADSGQSRDVCCLSAPLRGTRFERSRVPERTVHSAQAHSTPAHLMYWSEARKRGTTTYCTHIITGYHWLANDMRSRRGTSPSHHVPPRPTPHKYTRDC